MEGPYYQLLNHIGDLKTDYNSYMKTSPIDCIVSLFRFFILRYRHCIKSRTII